MFAPLLEQLPEELRRLANVVVYHLPANQEELIHATAAILQDLVKSHKATVYYFFFLSFIFICLIYFHCVLLFRMNFMMNI
jgi:hypothetical protein